MANRIRGGIQVRNWRRSYPQGRRASLPRECTGRIGILCRILPAAALFALLFPTGVAAAPAVEPPPRTVLIYAGTLLDRPGRPPRGPSTIVVSGDRIKSVQQGFVAPAEAGSPEAAVVDLRDQFVLPGLIDSHVHMFDSGEPLKQRLEAQTQDIEDLVFVGVQNARLDLQAGFTTERDLASPPRSIASLRDAVEQGIVEGPTIVPAGNMISVTAGHGDANGLNRDASEARRRELALCDSAESCRHAVREQIFLGAEVIKFAATGGVLSNISAGLGQQMFDDEMKAIVDTAHMFGRKVAAHAHAKAGIAAALRAGVDSVEHATYTDAETNALFIKTGAYLVPTLLAPVSAMEQVARGEWPPVNIPKIHESNDNAFKNIRAAVAAGVKIAFGTDAGVSRHGVAGREFNLLLRVGLTPARAIEVATVNAADLLGRSDQIGTIEPGKFADIIAVARSPLADVTELERVQFVMRKGVVHKLAGKRQAFPPESP
jgi:imidazolonepropionase-like amidohydrolase